MKLRNRLYGSRIYQPTHVNELDAWENLVKLSEEEKEIVSVMFEQVGYPRLPWGMREDGEWRQ